MGMKLSQYAKQQGITYRTAYNHFKSGILAADQLPTGTIIVRENLDNLPKEEKVCVYARVSSSENKNNLERQADRLISYCNAKGWKVEKVVKEIGSGLNDNRKKLLSVLEDTSLTIIVVEHGDRFSRFGRKFVETLLNKSGRRLEIINASQNDKDDLMADFVSIITSFTARLYGLRRSKRKTEKLIEGLTKNED